MRKWLSLAAFIIIEGCAIQPNAQTISNGGQAPVQSVNSAIGNVLVPTVQRQVSTPLDISNGSATWTYPTAFTNMPTCWPTISSPNPNFVYSSPTITASQTSATVSVSAANKILAISLGSLTVWATPPSGATITLSCVAPLP